MLALEVFGQSRHAILGPADMFFHGGGGLLESLQDTVVLEVGFMSAGGDQGHVTEQTRLTREPLGEIQQTLIARHLMDHAMKLEVGDEVVLAVSLGLESI